MALLLTGFVILAVLCTRSLGQLTCVTPDPGERTITVRDEYGCGILQCYNLTRNESNYENYTFAGWILPNLEVLNTTYNDSRIWVSNEIDSFTITVTNVSRDDIGMYHCMLTRNSDGETFLIRTGLNIKGPFFVTLWEDYRMNTIVGCSAFGGFIVLMIFIMVIYHFRYEKPDKETLVFDAFSAPTLEDGEMSKLPAYNGAGTGYSPVSDLTPSFDGTDLRKRSPLTQKKEENLDAFTNARLGLENKGFVSDKQASPELSEKVVGDFFGEVHKDEHDTMDTAF